MIALNEEQLKALDKSSDAPPRVIDPATAKTIVLLKSEDFDWLRGILDDEPDAVRLTDPRNQQKYALVPLERYERFKAFFEEDPITIDEQRQLLSAAGERAGWHDPAFDVYDDLDTREPK
jgi:hypothetical protein